MADQETPLWVRLLSRLYQYQRSSWHLSRLKEEKKIIWRFNSPSHVQWLILVTTIWLHGEYTRIIHQLKSSYAGSLAPSHRPNWHGQQLEYGNIFSPSDKFYWISNFFCSLGAQMIKWYSERNVHQHCNRRLKLRLYTNYETPHLHNPTIVTINTRWHPVHGKRGWLKIHLHTGKIG